MQIVPDQVGQKIKIDSTDPVITALGNHGITNVKLIFAFASNAGGTDVNKFPWKVHVLFNSQANLERANLDVNTVLQNTKIKSMGDEVIETIYPGGWIGYCTVINGQAVWIT